MYVEEVIKRYNEYQKEAELEAKYSQDNSTLQKQLQEMRVAMREFTDKFFEAYPEI